MLYLSKIVLTPHQEEREHLHNIYQLHQKLWQGFGKKPNDKDRDFLFRIDPGHGKTKEILLQSLSEPNWSRIFPDQGVQMKSFSPHFIEGQRFFFYLRANAMVAKMSERNAKGRTKKRPMPAEQYKDWFLAQGEKHGFSVQLVDRVGDVTVWGYKQKSEEKQQSKQHLRFTGQNLQGHLQVTDVTQFSEIYQKGLGRGKAFGFGLLSLIKE